MLRKNNGIINNTVSFRLKLPFNLIQEIRLSHALMESDFNVYLDKCQANKFSYIKKNFEVHYYLDENLLPILPKVEICHKSPFVRLGSLRRPLVYPHGIFDYCRKIWGMEKEFYCTFTGLATESRLNIIKLWLENYFQIYLKRNKLFKIFESEKYIYRTELGKIIFYFTKRGRKFPLKSWDEQYYRILARSKYVLCPDGDYKWSYRFFEATMCGAIPIVQTEIPLYEGFVFYKMTDSPYKFKWSEELVHHNYNLCRKLLSIPLDDLNRELNLLLKI